MGLKNSILKFSEKITGVPYRWRRNMPSIMLLVAFACFLTIGISFDDLLGPASFVSALLSLAGTFIGAFLAFGIQQIKEEDASEDSRVQAINRALMVLVFQYNIMASWNKILDKHKTNLDRMIRFRPIRQSEKFEVRQKLDELIFLAEIGNAQLILQVSLEQERFDAAGMALEERAKYFVNEIEPLIEKHEMNEVPSKQEMFDAFGPRHFGTLYTLTNEVYRHVPKTLPTISEAVKELREFAKRIYPHRKFIDFKDISGE